MAKTKKADKKTKKGDDPMTSEAAEQEINTAQKETEETLNEEIERELGKEKEFEKVEEIPVETPAVEMTEEQKDFRDMYIRLMAEFDNYRKRTQREKADLIRFGNKDLMTALLPVLDDMQRTLTAVEKTDNLTAVKDGIRLVSKNINKVFSRQGLEAIESKGEEFDTELHEAIGSLDMGEEHQGKVIEEAEKGYRYKDQVIRYAKVIVGD